MFKTSHLIAALTPECGNDIVAWRKGTALDKTALVQQVAAWRDTLSKTAPSEHVAIYFQDSFDAAAALLGAWQAGCTVILPSDAQAETVKRLKGKMQAHLLGEFPGAEPTPLPSTQIPHFKTLLPEHLAVIVFTSGSTGEQVAIPKTLQQLMSEVATQATLWQNHLQNQCIVSTVSHQHIYGLLFRLLLPLTTGRPFIAERLEYPEEVQAHLTLRPSVLISSPAFLKRLPEDSTWPASPSAVFSSGGPLSKEAAIRAENKLSAPVFEIYGSSETGGVAWRQQTEDSSWKALPGVELELDAGLLTVRSAHTQNHDWHRSSDHAKLINSSTFELQGRVDRLVKIEEKRVSLDGIESALLLNPEVLEAKVLVLPGERARLGAVIVLSAEGKHLLTSQGKRALNEILRNKLLQQVERVALPRYWRYVETMPSNSMGKTALASLLALFEPINTSRHPLVLQREVIENRIVLHLAVEPNLPYFDGHFPVLPILPGVALLQWVEHFGRIEFPALPPDFMRMDAIKFQQIIRPGSVIQLELEWLPEKSVIAFKVTSTQGPHASGKMCFGSQAA